MTFTPEEQLASFIDKFLPEIAELTRAAIEFMRQKYPNAISLVYDNYNALAIGFGPTEKTREVIFSVAVYASGPSLCFLQAGESNISDPHQLLLGSGKLNRFIRINDISILSDPKVQALIDQASENAKVPMSLAAGPKLIIKSISEKQQSRRPLL